MIPKKILKYRVIFLNENSMLGMLITCARAILEKFVCAVQ
jgi:hypothetical protein